ncbi:MAG: hypothetical protein COB54_04525 [Alphaproteobacteria bacterium]|nr:MAG: hypothetical protein COB54_04525 [Alphaproteobacteria bacterium]
MLNGSFGLNGEYKMILRKFTKHIVDQNWFAVGLDVIVVVVGIFLGMMMTEWNEKRQLRGTEGQYLLSLRADLETSITLADSRLDDLYKISDACYRLIQQSKLEVPTITSDEMDHLVYQCLYAMGILGQHRTTLDEMKSSGKFSIIDDIELRKALQNIDVFYQEVKLMEMDIYDFLKSGVEPFLIKNYDSLQFQQHSKNIIHSPNQQKQYPVEPLEDFTPLLKSREFKNYVNWRYSFTANATSEVSDLKTEYQTILILIDKRIAALN